MYVEERCVERGWVECVCRISSLGLSGTRSSDFRGGRSLTREGWRGGIERSRVVERGSESRWPTR